MSLSEMLQESVSLIRKYTDRVPVIGLVLGSGL